MLRTPLRLAAIGCSVILMVSWGLFALDETRAASELSAKQVAGNEAAGSANPTPAEERARERAHGKARELIDDANDVLVAPFASVTSGIGDQWGRRTLPALLGLIVYGFGLAFLARFIRM